MNTPTVVQFVADCQSENFSPFAIGYIVKTENSIHKGTGSIQKATEDEAKYHALIQGLEVASEMGCTKVKAKGDSQVVVDQVTGEYYPETPTLAKPWSRVRQLIKEFESFEIVYVEQEERVANKLAYQKPKS